MGWQELSVSTAPFSDIVSGTLGPGAAILIAVVALFATANTALMSMYASSRILYGMAGSSRLTARFARVHPGTANTVDCHSILRCPLDRSSVLR